MALLPVVATLEMIKQNMAGVKVRCHMECQPLAFAAPSHHVANAVQQAGMRPTGGQR